jgi:predicted enzyme involved in methoxymalonyl-ACP biosynthesis
MGRKVERAMLYWAVRYARSANLDELYAVYVPTAKNKPCLDFWKDSGFRFNPDDDAFRWRTDAEYELPDCIRLQPANGSNG